MYIFQDRRSVFFVTALRVARCPPAVAASAVAAALLSVRRLFSGLKDS
jgi:hypothetical protein